MLKKIKNSLFILGLVAALVTGLSSCGGNELKVDPSIVIGPGNAKTILGEDTSVTVLLADFKDTPEKVDLFKKDAEEATATDLTVKDNAIVIPTSTWAAGAYEIYVQAEDVKSNVITLAIAKNANEKIIISPAVSGQKGDTLSIVVAFSNLKAEPSTVDVWVDNAEEALAKGLDVTNNTISLSTSDLDSGSTNIYVVAGDLKSSTCTITLTTPPAPVVVPPKTPAITIEGPAKVTQGNSWKNEVYLNMTFKDIEGYDFIKHPVLSLYIDGKKITDFEVTYDYYSIDPTYLSNTSLGKHKVYFTMENPTVKSNELEIEVVDGPVDPEVTVKKSDIKNKVELTWNRNGAEYYHIYCSNQEELSTNDYRTYVYYGNSLKLKYSYLFPTSKADGKYYFWVVASDSSSQPDVSDITTKPVEYNFTRDEHTAPTGLKVTPVTGKANYVNVTWDDNKSQYYCIYKSDTSTRPSNPYNYNTYEYTKEGIEFCLSSSGTYYFWIKSVDSSFSEDTPISEAVSYDFTYTKPSPVTNLTAVEYNSPKNSVKLSWTKSNAGSYYIYMNTTDNYSTAKYETNTTSDLYTKMLPTAGKYYFWVIAADNGNYTEEDAVKVDYTLATFDDDGISAPENLAIQISTTNSNYINVNCDPVTISGYNPYYWVYYSTTDDPKTATCCATAYQLPASIYKYSYYFESNTTYYFWIKAGTNNWAANDLMISDVSDSVEFIPYPTNN